MTKAELIDLLKPFDDDIEVLVDGPTSEWTINGYEFRWEGDTGKGRFLIEVNR